MKVRIPQQGGMSNMSEMLKKAQKMQEEMAATQAALEEKEYEVSAGGGAVTVKISGKREILALDIDPDVVDPDDVEMLSDILIAAINEAIKKVDSVSEEEMAKISGQMGLPGMF
ncbi:MAG: YbaB/EbfC family nucleoid-associated protein [Ruminococcaceae bacterium]|nr:YbaB/EbfC family nucleoid-associated protein [Oscillospiraceae bacterium]